MRGKRDCRSLVRAPEFFGFVTDPLSAFVKTAETWGDVAVLSVPGPRTIQVSHPNHVTRVLKMPFRDKLATLSLRDLLGEGLITTRRSDFVARRRLVGKPLSRSAVAQHVDTMRELTRKWLDQHLPKASDTPMAISRELFALSLDILLTTVFGSRVEIDQKTFAQHLDAYMFEFFLDNTSWRRLLPQQIETAGRKRRAQAVAAMRHIIEEAIEKRRSAPPDGDLLYHFLDPTSPQMNPADLLDELLTMIIPGHETPALMLGYALYALSKNRDTQARLYAELEGFDRIDLDVVAQCPYLTATVDESFRLYPPAYVTGREVDEDVVLDGVRLEKGDQVIATQWVVHRDRRWWKAPTSFRPERWVNGETEDLAPGTYFPFGAGARSCLGGHFSVLMGQVVVGEVARRAEIVCDPSYDLSFIQGPTLRPKQEIRVQLRPREQAVRTKPDGMTRFEARSMNHGG